MRGYFGHFAASFGKRAPQPYPPNSFISGWTRLDRRPFKKLGMPLHGKLYHKSFFRPVRNSNHSYQSPRLVEPNVLQINPPRKASPTKASTLTPLIHRPTTTAFRAYKNCWAYANNTYKSLLMQIESRCRSRRSRRNAGRSRCPHCPTNRKRHLISHKKLFSAKA